MSVLNTLLNKANQGDLNAQWELATSYFDGADGIQQNYQEAFTWMMKVAQAGYDLAQYNVGQFYYQGIATKVDLTEALKWLKLAADQDNAAAQNTIGWIYMSEENYMDLKEAEKWLTVSAAAGNQDAIDNLGDLQKMRLSGAGSNVDDEDKACCDSDLDDEDDNSDDNEDLPIWKIIGESVLRHKNDEPVPDQIDVSFDGYCLDDDGNENTDEETYLVSISLDEGTPSFYVTLLNCESTPIVDWSYVEEKYNEDIDSQLEDCGIDKETFETIVRTNYQQNCSSNIRPKTSSQIIDENYTFGIFVDSNWESAGDEYFENNNIDCSGELSDAERKLISEKYLESRYELLESNISQYDICNIDNIVRVHLTDFVGIVICTDCSLPAYDHIFKSLSEDIGSTRLNIYDFTSAYCQSYEDGELDTGTITNDRSEYLESMEEMKNEVAGHGIDIIQLQSIDEMPVWKIIGECVLRFKNDITSFDWLEVSFDGYCKDEDDDDIIDEETYLVSFTLDEANPSFYVLLTNCESLPTVDWAYIEEKYSDDVESQLEDSGMSLDEFETHVRKHFRDSIEGISMETESITPEPTEERAKYDVILKAAGSNMINVIKVVRVLTNLDLKESRDLLDDAPGVVISGVSIREAEEAKEQLVEAGAEVEIKKSNKPYF